MKTLLLLLITLIITSCTKQNNKNKAEDYFLSAFKQPFSEKSNETYLKLNSIIKHDTLARFILFKGKASYSIIVHSKNDVLYDEGDIRTRNIIFVQCKCDSLIILNKKDTIHLERVSDTISKMILNPTDESKFPHKKLISNECFTNYPASKAIVIIEAQHLKFIKNNESLVDEWHCLMKQISMVENAFNKIRNEISMERWNCQTDKLDLAKLKCLDDIYPITVWINFYENNDFK
jgi:hypothetical protein